MSLLSRTCYRGIAAAVGMSLILLWSAPAAEITVRLLVKDGAPMGEVKTDQQGHYRILLHVHNEDVYKVFDMRVNNVTRKVRLLFNPNDRQTERGQRVDLVVKRQGDFETSGIPAQ
jgi:hypothetical protein